MKELLSILVIIESTQIAAWIDMLAVWVPARRLLIQLSQVLFSERLSSRIDQALWLLHDSDCREILHFL